MSYYYFTAPSSPPENIEVTNADPASLQVTWQPPLKTSSNEAITGYVIVYARGGSDEIVDTMILNVPNETTITLLGLLACTEYSVTVAAVNANGTGPFSNPVTGTSGEDSELNKPCIHIAYQILLHI